MEIMSKQQVEEEFSISERTLELWVKDGKFPPPVRLGKRAYWTREAIERWKNMTFAFQMEFKPR
jgi:prophage regulatory protein